MRPPGPLSPTPHFFQVDIVFYEDQEWKLNRLNRLNGLLEIRGIIHLLIQFKSLVCNLIYIHITLAN